LAAPHRGRTGFARAAVLTEAQVWEALAEVPDPEIPVISVVDLGVVRDVRIEGERVHVELTPTFLGCPALEVMRDQMAERIARLGAEPEVEVVLDDSWSTDRITPGQPPLQRPLERERIPPLSLAGDGPALGLELMEESLQGGHRFGAGCLQV
jgi:ring-1,2-phenylacetyl-CoA epoxidase subunit PaaD